MPTFSGSSDALTLAPTGQRAQSLVAVLTASAGDATPARRNPVVRARSARAPAAGLGNAALRQLLAAPRPDFRTTGDALRPSRAANATCWCRPRHAATASPARRLFWPIPSSQKARRSTPNLARPDDAGRLCERHQVVSPGEYSIRGGGRPLPDGLAPALPARSLRRRNRASRPSTSTRSAPLSRCRKSPAAGARFPLDDKGPRALPPALPRNIRGDPAKSVSTRIFPAAFPRPASSTGCRCSSTKRRRCSTTAEERAALCLHNDVPKPSVISGATRSRADMLSGEKTRPLLPPATFSQRRNLLHRRQTYAGWCSLKVVTARQPRSVSRRRPPRRRSAPS